MAPKVEYLGYLISQGGIQPTEEKVKAIAEAPRPTGTSELKAFLGLLNYYGKFLPDLVTKVSPLYQLLHKNAAWRWGATQEKAFNATKVALQSPPLLAHYDSSKDLVLSCDASPVGVGTVLAHWLADGTEQPIAYVSRTLAPAEQ